VEERSNMEQEREMIGNIVVFVRVPAFWRLLHSVYTMSKGDPDVFFGEINGVEVVDDPVDQHLLSMIMDMNTGTSARAMLWTEDLVVVAGMMRKVLRAYEKMPEIHGKINTCWAAQTVGNMINQSICGGAKALERADEVRLLSKSFYELSLHTKGREGLALEGTLTQASDSDPNWYYSFVVYA